MYNDNQIIDENNLIKLKREYEDSLFATKTLSNEDKSLEDFNKLKFSLLDAKHYISNLVKLSKNKDNLQLLQSNLEKIDNIINDLHTLYDISETVSEEQNAGNFNYYINLSSAIDSLLNFVSGFFVFLKNESNTKVKACLENIMNIVLEVLKDLNALCLKVSNVKVFSLFHRY